MANKKTEEAPIFKMKKPTYKVGDKVVVTFLGAERKCEIIEIQKINDKWMLKAKDIHDGFKYVHIGINGTEKFANIWEQSKENLDNTNE